MDTKDYFVNSSKLKEIRDTIKTFPELAKHIGKPIQLSFVVDTNIIIGEILWLVQKRKNPEAKTQLQEIIAAETVILSAPHVLISEIEEHLPKIADKKGLCPVKLLDQWMEYRKSIKFIDVPKEKLFKPRLEDDEKDIPFVVLKQMIKADGILSKDSDISRMDNDAVNIQCIASLQSYSRASAIQLSIKVNGTMIAFASLAALLITFEGIKALISGIINAPKGVQYTILGAVIIAAIHPTSRNKVVQFLTSTYNVSAEHLPLFLEFIAKHAEIAMKHQDKASLALEKLPENLKQKIEV